VEDELISRLILHDLLSKYGDCHNILGKEPAREYRDCNAEASRRQSCLKIDLFSGDGVMESQKLGVQEISSIAGEAGQIFQRLAGQAVQWIANERMADGCQMDSDLMRASRIEAYLKCCGARVCCVACAA
jgi:hypothetical protein